MREREKEREGEREQERERERDRWMERSLESRKAIMSEREREERKRGGRERGEREGERGGILGVLALRACSDELFYSAATELPAVVHTPHSSFQLHGSRPQQCSSNVSTLKYFGKIFVGNRLNRWSRCIVITVKQKYVNCLETSPQTLSFRQALKSHCMIMY